MSLRVPEAPVIAALLALASCGGASSQPASAPHGADARSGNAATDGASSDQGGEPVDPAAELCSDGSCFRCGDGVCPAGYYCDDKAPAGAACGWLPECAKTADCACIQSALGSGCHCDNQGGGVHVTCN